MKILMTGGSGGLGTELSKHLRMITPTSMQMDITMPVERTNCDLVIHAAAYTNTVEDSQELCEAINVTGTRHMVETYGDKPFVYISTEYVIDPKLTNYAFSKLVGEILVSNNCHNYLIIRTLFKPNPFPWDEAYEDQYTQGDYVDVIAKLLANEVLHWNRKGKRIVYLGTGRKTMYDLARRTRPDVIPISTPPGVPKDYL